MDVLTARHSTGGLHAVTADHPPGFGPRFEQTMKMQGLTVTRYSADEWREYCSRRTEVSPPRKTAQDDVQQNSGKVDAQTAEINQPETSVPAQEIKPSGLTLPTIGETIVHPVVGYATITHFITLNGQPVPVATGPRGQGLVKPGEWRAATDDDRPFWMRQPDSLTSDPPERIAPVPPVPAAAASTGVDSPQPVPVPSSPEPASSSGTPAFKPGEWIRQHASGIPHLVNEKGTATRCGLGIRTTATLAQVFQKTPTCGLCERDARLQREANARRGHA